MSTINPWDILSPSHHGDEDISITYLAVGRALSAWEVLEAHLALFYGIFKGVDAVEGLKERAGKVFRERSREVSRAFGQFRITHPDQLFEGEFEAFMSDISMLSDRRNDIAHGRVQVLQHYARGEAEVASGKLRPLHMLAPSWYRDTRFEGPAGGPYFPFPEYTYTASEINQYEVHFLSYAQKARRLYEAALGLKKALPS